MGDRDERARRDARRAQMRRIRAADQPGCPHPGNVDSPRRRRPNGAWRSSLRVRTFALPLEDVQGRMDRDRLDRPVRMARGQVTDRSASLDFSFSQRDASKLRFSELAGMQGNGAPEERRARAAIVSLRRQRDRVGRGRRRPVGQSRGVGAARRRTSQRRRAHRERPKTLSSVHHSARPERRKLAHGLSLPPRQSMRGLRRTRGKRGGTCDSVSLMLR